MIRWTQLFMLGTVVVMIMILSGNQASKTSYWQTYVRKRVFGRAKDATEKKICFPNQTQTRESLGNIITKNISTLCISGRVEVFKVSGMGWQSDFKCSKKVITITIKSGQSRMHANKMNGVVFFASAYKLVHDKNYARIKSQVQECGRFLGRGFKRNQEMTFKCEKVVEGRYFYVWKLGKLRLSPLSISEMKFEFAIEVEVNPWSGFNPMAGQEVKNFLVYFEYMTGWDEKVAKGFWMVKLGKIGSLVDIYMCVTSRTKKTYRNMRVDMGVLGKNGLATYSGERTSIESADGKSYIVQDCKMTGDVIRVRSTTGGGFLDDAAITSIELQLADGTNYFAEVKIDRKTRVEQAIKKVCLNGKMRVWEDESYKVTGWIMIDLTKRYMVASVMIKSGRHSQVITDLQGLTISTSNIIPAFSFDEIELVESDICGSVGPNVKIVPNRENNIKCLPKPSLGTYVLIYNRLKPLRIYAVRNVKVYVAMDKLYFFNFPVPKYARIPRLPPVTKLPINGFFCVTMVTSGAAYGYWILDMLEPKKVKAVVIKAGNVATRKVALVIFVQDSFTEDLNQECASFMTDKFKSGSEKYLPCQPTPKTGMYVIVANSYTGYPRILIRSIQVRFVHGRNLQYVEPKIPNPKVPGNQPDTSLQRIIDWNVLYETFEYRKNPLVWWVFDLGTKYQVIQVTLHLKFDSSLLKDIRSVYVGMTNNRDDYKPKVCQYYRSDKAMGSSLASKFSFLCAIQEHFRYVLFRAEKACFMFPVKVLQSITFIVKKGSRYLNANVDMTSSFLPISSRQQHWKKAPQLSSVRFMNIRAKKFSFASPLVLISITVSVKTSKKIKLVRILMSNSGSLQKGFKSCYWFKTPKSTIYFHDGSKYKLRCGYRKEAFKYIFVQIQPATLIRIRFTFKRSNRYYYYVWKGH